MFCYAGVDIFCVCAFIRSFVRLLCVLANVIIVFVYVFHESCATALVFGYVSISF